MENPFIGTWILNLEKSQFDAEHRPTGGKIIFELDPEGRLLMTAEGIGGNGAKVAERPQEFVPDGIFRPLDGLPGLSSVCRSPNADCTRGRGQTRRWRRGRQRRLRRFHRWKDADGNDIRR